jgi:hypothetical protein
MEDSFWASANEPEIDMNRGGLRGASVGLVKRLFKSLHHLHAHRGAFGTPCRSIDQKTQEHWPVYEE